MLLIKSASFWFVDGEELLDDIGEFLDSLPEGTRIRVADDDEDDDEGHEEDRRLALEVAKRQDAG